MVTSTHIFSFSSPHPTIGIMKASGDRAVSPSLLMMVQLQVDHRQLLAKPPHPGSQHPFSPCLRMLTAVLLCDKEMTVEALVARDIIQLKV